MIRSEDRYWYEDLGSRNGSIVEVNGDRRVVLSGDKCEVTGGARLLLGDRIDPVVLVIRERTTPAVDDEEGTILASRSVIAPNMLFDVFSDRSSQKELFELLYELSGTVETEPRFRACKHRALRRFTHAESVNIMMKDVADEWVCEFERVVHKKRPSIRPSLTLLERAVKTQEVVSYVPGPELDTERSGSRGRRPRSTAFAE